jgi:RNA polymerase sigma-70 factor (ECF subfamily)
MDVAVRRARASRPDSPLVEAAKAGHAWALTRIWQQHAPAVTGYLRGHGAAEPQDAASDVFVAVFERIRTFRGDDEALRSFIFTVAHHRLVDELRKRSRRGETAEYHPESDPRQVGSAEDAALESLGNARLHQLLGELSSDQREVMLLRVVGDLTLEQTATVLGKRVGAVKALQHRALAALRRLLDQAVSL